MAIAAHDVALVIKERVADGQQRAEVDDVLAVVSALRDPALDGYFGAFRQRIEIARSVLDDAGATDDDLAGLSEAWLTALAERDQFDADIGLEL